MILDKDTIKVNNANWGQYLVEVKFGYHKIWSKDTGRNMNATMSGTLKGIFPKITLQFKRLTKEELEAIAPTLDSALQEIQYYDPNEGIITLETYTNDWEVVNKGLLTTHGAKNEGFSVSFISTSKR